jgi:single-strand DNA-binding protein
MRTEVTLIGNVVADPELRFTPTGKAVAKFRVASTTRRKGDDGQWYDQDTLFMDVSVWREQAENVVESLARGVRVVVHGDLKQRQWEDREGNPRTSWEILADEIGVSLRRATVAIKKTERSGDAAVRSTEEDPWARQVPDF